MSKLHELLAVQDTLATAAKKLVTDTDTKLRKPQQYFIGATKSLKMIADTPENTQIERAGTEEKALPTTVKRTLEYMLDIWAKAEDVRYQINRTNQNARADIIFRGNVFESDVPVDELLGLEGRLLTLRNLLDTVPTLDPSRSWTHSEVLDRDVWVSATPDVTTKTEKVMSAVVLHPGSDKHPAQVKEVTTDKVVGAFTTIFYNGAATSMQKAEALTVVDELLEAVKTARMRANMVDVVNVRIGKKIADLIMAPFAV